MALSGLWRLPAAVRGALAFLTRLPVGGGAAGWDAFRRTPASFPLAGYVVGALLAVPFGLSGLLAGVGVDLPAASTAALYLLAVYGLTGVAHADGLADLADAAAVHERADEGGVDGEDAGAGDHASGARGTGDAPGDPARERRRAVLKDSRTGVGGVLAVAAAVAALVLGALGLAQLVHGGPVGGAAPGAGAWAAAGSWAAVATVVAAEVGAKAGMGLLACLGSPAHEGLGSQLVGESDGRGLVGVAAASLPAVLLAGAAPVAVGVLGLGVLAGPLVALAVRRWASARLGGVSGDAFGAANELGRVAALHVGVIAWALA
ncbi:MAG: adenosylcobinamide-GDP ribazoletransferase [Haloferacaceae archaeon]